jgi:hypothetical protein
MTEIWKTIRVLLVLVVGRGILEDKQSYKIHPGSWTQLPASPWQTCPPGLQGFFVCCELLGRGLRTNGELVVFLCCQAGKVIA